MITQAVLGLVMVSSVALAPIEVRGHSAQIVAEKQVVASRDLDLKTRLPNAYGAQVFADNILLALHYQKGDVESLRISKSSPAINWDEARKPFEYSFTLKPGEAFAFHNNLLPQFKDLVVTTMNSRFYMDEGYLALNGLGGNGVCHLASVMNWVATDAGLEVVAPVNHDFYPVPGVPRINGTAIMSSMAEQNLYIKNNFEVPVEFTFKADNSVVHLTISK